MMSSSQVCEFHMRGRCRYGNRCWKSHDLGTSRNRELFNTETHLSVPRFVHPDSRIFDAGFNFAEISAQFEGYRRKIELEKAMLLNPILRQPDNGEIAIEKEVKELSVAKKSENGNSIEENASNLNVLEQKKMKESTENNGSVWDCIILSAIDSDFQCNICLEIFIKPTVVNCSHTFCESCIHVWTLRVKNCPICRVEVTSKSCCLTLECFIEKIVEHLPIEIKNKREAAIKERNKIKIEKPQRMNYRLNRSALSGFMYMDRQAEATTQPRQNQVERNVDTNADILSNESEMSRMTLHDPDVRRVNTPMPNFATPEAEAFYRSIQRSLNFSRD